MDLRRGVRSSFPHGREVNGPQRASGRPLKSLAGQSSAKAPGVAIGSYFSLVHQIGEVGGNRDGVIANIAFLVDKARAEDVPVVWVQHSADDMPKGSDGWLYVPELTQAEAESVVHKRYGDSFENTDLEAVLAERKVGRLIVTGAPPHPTRSSTTRTSTGSTTPLPDGTQGR